MHTAEELRDDDFEYRVDGRPVPREDVLPPIGPTDRVGVVMRTGTEGLGAGNVVLSSVTRFYERLREEAEEFFEYPDFYTFQTGPDPADYGMLDVYPEHKSVAVAPDPERVLRAVNDRAVDVLLVPDVAPDAPDVSDVTRRSAERGIDRCYRYAADGNPENADFSVGLPADPAFEWFEAVAATTGTDPDVGGHFARRDDGTLTQRFAAIPLEEALARLPRDDGSALE